MDHPHKKIIIAIDGPAASGKNTLARAIAKHYRLDYLDTGKLYRALAYLILQQTPTQFAINSPAHQNIISKLAPQLLDPTLLSKLELTYDETAQEASKLASLDYVRQALLKTQQFFAKNPNSRHGAVLDGRDIGTVVCPDASVKIFVDANIKIRAQRRFKELTQLNQNVSYDTILEQMKTRDLRDRTRAIAPLKAAQDAYIIDSSNLDAKALYHKACSFIDQKLGAV
ncbi:MAG: (d)CMP kinase [Pseudomonadota bacterium]